MASGLGINGCVLSYFEGTANLHCYTSCTLTTLPGLKAKKNPEPELFSGGRPGRGGGGGVAGQHMQSMQ